MLDALTVTEVGMQNDVQRLHSIGHNVANAGTVGFKREIAATRPFIELLAEQAPVGDAGTSLNIRPVLTLHIDHSDGALKYTGNPLDLGLEGGGFFAVTTPFGEAYTRQGNFRLDGSGRLVTAGGHPVIGEAGDIRLTRPDPRIDAQGNIFEGTTQVARLKIVSVKEKDALTRVGDGLYLPGESIELDSADAIRVRQGFTETSNVVAMSEMIKMIETVRHFEASQRLIRGYDDMLDRAINDNGEQ